MSTRKDKPDCRRCGCCCISLHDQEVFCDVLAEDEERLGKELSKKYVVPPTTWDMLFDSIGGKCSGSAIRTKWKKVKEGPLKGLSVCACVFLEGSPLHKVRCRVYENRPKACREAISPGEKACLECRRMLEEAIQREDSMSGPINGQRKERT